MSYNIDTWKTKRIKDFVIPLSAFDKIDDMTMTYVLGDKPYALKVEGGAEGFEINGHVSDDKMWLIVDVINLFGESSGTFYHDDLLPLLEKTTGELEVVTVWEGGDTIERLTVKDGVVETEEIDL